MMANVTYSWVEYENAMLGRLESKMKDETVRILRDTINKPAAKHSAAA